MAFAIITTMAAKTWDEIYGEGANVAQTPTNALTEAQLADKDFLRQMCTKELAAIVRKNNGDIKGVPAINALWDRIDGKPGQAITMDATLRTVNIDCQISFTDEKQYIDVDNSALTD